MSDPRSDEALCEALLGGELLAFDALYARYERPLFGFVRRHLRDGAESEDVLHEAFLAILKERNALRATSSFRAWLYQVARHLCLNRLRSQRRAAHALAPERQAPEMEPPRPNEVLEARERHATLRAALERLPSELAELYTLRANGLSYEEMAHVLEVPVGTVKSRMHSMVARLREEMTT